MKSEMDIKNFLSAPEIHSVSYCLPVIAVTPYRFSLDHPTACGILYFVFIFKMLFLFVLLN